MNKKENIEIVYYSDTYEEAHFDFATKNYGKRRKRRNKDYLYWKFRGEEGKELKSFVLAYDKVSDKVVGQIGLIPFFVKIEGKTYQTAWRCDVMLDEDYRGLGIAQMMYAKTHEEFNLLFNCGSSISAKKAILKMGYKPIKRSFSYTLPTDLSFFNKVFSLNVPFLKMIPNFLFSINSIFYKSVFFSEISISDYVTFSETYSTHDSLIKTYKSNDFINWRFKSFKNYYEGIKTYKSDNGIFFSGYYTKANIYFITEVASFKFSDVIKVLKFIKKTYTNDGLKQIQFCFHPKGKLIRFAFFGCFTFNFNPQNMFYTNDKKLEKLILDKEFLFQNYDCDKNL